MSVIAISVGVAAAAFFVSLSLPHGIFAFISILVTFNVLTSLIYQGRAGLVALRRHRGGVGSTGRAFYKGGFEPRMNKREASLILELSYVEKRSFRLFEDRIIQKILYVHS